MTCSCHSVYTVSLTMSFLERWLQENALLGAGAQAAAYLKVLMQARCTDDCGLEQGSISLGWLGLRGFMSSPRLSMGAKLISSILISQNQEGRSDITAKPWLTDTISTDPV